MRPGHPSKRIVDPHRAHGRVFAAILAASFLNSACPVYAADVVRDKTPAPEAPASPEVVQQTFLKGKALYDAGDVEAALLTWRALDPVLGSYPSVRNVIEFLKKRAAAPAAAGVPPVDVSSTLEKAAEEMQARRDEAERAQQALKGDRNDWVRDAFQKGRAAFEDGDWAAAIQEWERMASYLDESSPERATVEALKRDYFAAEKMRGDTRRAIEQSKVKLKAPAGLSQALEEAKSKLRAALEQASTQTSAASKARAEREAWVDATLVRARASYEEGRIAPAIEEWEKALPFLENEAELREKIKTLRQDLDALQDVQSRNDSASAEAFARIRVPLGDRLSAEIARATDMLRSREGRAMQQQKELEKSLAEREQWIAAQFEKGRQFLDAGRVDDALAQWEPILPNVEGGGELRASLDRARSQLQAAKAAEETAARGGPGGKLKAPPELEDLLEKAGKTLADKRADAETRRRDVEGLAAKKQKDVSAAFEKGKNFYVDGKFWEAAEAWKGMLPLVEEAPQLEKWINQFEASYREYLDSKNAVDRLAAERERKFSAPADILKLLTQAQQDVEARTAALVAERASMEKGASEHAGWVQDTFRKGKTLADQGRIDLALAEWEKLLPHLDESAPERALILDLRRQRDQAKSASERIGELTASGKGRIQAPTDLKVVLESAIDASRAKQRELELEEQAVTRSIDERRDAMLEILQSGKNAFEAGRPEDALTEWKKLLQYVDARSKLDETLKKFEQSTLEQRAAKQKLADAQSRGGSRFEPPEELAVSIGQAADKIAADASSARAEKADIEKQYSQRKLWIDQTYQAGRQHYAAGRLEEAVDEWSKLSPYLPEESGLPARLAQVKAVKDDAVRAKKAAVEAVAQQYKGLRIDPQIEAFLSDISKDLKTQTIQGQKDKQKADETLSAGQKKTDAILKEGKTLADAGDLGAALITWSGLLPYLPEGSPSRQSILDMRRQFDELQKTRAAAADAQKSAQTGIEPPSDFAKLVDEARRRLDAQRQAADEELRRSSTARTAREKSTAAAYEEAKTKLWNGDVAGAIAGWKSISGQLEGAPALVDGLESQWALAQKARDAAAAAAGRSSEKLAAPADFAKEVESARQKIRSMIDEQMNQKMQSEKALIARQSELVRTYERGKALYWSGKIPEALAEWKNVVAAVSDPDASEAFDALQKSYAKMLDSQKAAADASATASAKLPAPAELAKLLSLALEKTRAAEQAAQAEKAKMAADLAARRAKAEEAFQKGASAANAGKFDEAVSQWRALEPLVDPQAGVGQALDALEKAMAGAADARREADDYAAGEFKDIKFTHGGEIAALVTQAQARLQAQAADARKAKADMEKTFADRQAWVESTFQKGKALFEQGRYAEAVEFWKSLVPYLIDGAQTDSMLEQFLRTQAEAASAVAEAVEAESKKDSRFPTPSELGPLLAAATEQIKTAQFDARTRREKVEQALSDRRVAIQSAFEKGRSAFEKGSVPSALEEWSKMLPMVDDEAKVKEALEAVRAAYELSVQARQDADAAEKRKEARLAVPPELRSTLESVLERMKKEIQAADLQREKMEKALADRRAYVRDILDRGKALYADGKLPEAFELWKSIGPYTDDEEKLNGLLSKAGQAYDSFVAAKAANHEAVLKQSTKLPTPPELLSAIEEAADKLKQDDFDSRGKTFEIEKSIADRREWIQSTFKKGQALYLEGRVPEAVAEWNTVLPYLEDGIDVKAKLVEIDKNAQLAEKSRRILAESQEKLKLQFQSPKELSELLLKANEDLKNQMFAASAEKMKAEQTLGDRQKWMNQTFDLGRSFYAEGKIGEALGEWSKLKPYLDGQPAIEEMMNTLKTNYDALQKAKKEAVEATAEDYKGLKLAYTDQMAKVLEAAVKKIGDETLILREKLEKTHATLAERKEWSVTTFNKGKVLYEDGRYAEALEQWQRLLPYLENDSPLKALIESCQKSYAEWADRKAAIGELEQRTEKPVQLAQPETMSVTLKEAAEKMKAQAEAASSRAADLEKQMAQRKEWIEYTFEKGKKLFDGGHYAEAVTEWGVLGPYLAEHPDVREQIEEAKRSYVQFRKADQILKNAQTKQAAQPPLPEGAEVPPPAEPAAEEPAQAPKTATPAAPAPAAAVPADAGKPQPAGELISGEILSVDREASTFFIRLVTDFSEKSVHYDGATQFDGAPGVSADKLDKGASVDVRVDSENRATYVYIY